MEKHFQNVVLQHVPENVKNFDAAKMCNKPNPNSYVFLKSKKTVTGVLLEDETGDDR